MPSTCIIVCTCRCSCDWREIHSVCDLCVEIFTLKQYTVPLYKSKDVYTLFLCFCLLIACGHSDMGPRSKRIQRCFQNTFLKLESVCSNMHTSRERKRKWKCESLRDKSTCTWIERNAVFFCSSIDNLYYSMVFLNTFRASLYYSTNRPTTINGSIRSLVE